MEDEEDMVAPGTMVSFWMVAVRPRWSLEVISEPRADLSSCEAMCYLVSFEACTRLRGVYRRFRTASWTTATN